MIISRAELGSAVTAYKTVKRKTSVASGLVETGDSFDPSDEASTLGDLFAQVTAEPYYRPALVERLRRQISEGRYYVSTEQIVEKLLGRLMVAAAY
jgi:anti-sigma28 factor (negative regulator of flagellin synthesis)